MFISLILQSENNCFSSCKARINKVREKTFCLISDTPLVVLTAKNLLKSKLFNEVFVVTDSDEIIEVLKNIQLDSLKAQNIMRQELIEFLNL